MHSVLPTSQPEDEIRWRRCPQAGCQNDFDSNPDGFVVGGDGDWLNTIVCRRCSKVRKRVPDEVIVELLHEQLLEAGVDSKLITVQKWFSKRKVWWAEKIKAQSQQ